MTTESIYKSPQAQEQILGIYERFLAALPFKNDQFMIPTRHGQTFCLACGDENNPPLILIHGSGSNSAVWAGEFPEYNKHFRVYALDIIGEPGKSEANRPSLHGPAYAEWLLDIMTYLKIAPGSAPIVGLSLGGWMALRFATCYPQYVQRLVILSSAGICDMKPSFALRGLIHALRGDRGILEIGRMICRPHRLDPTSEQTVLLISKNFRYRRAVPLFSDEDLRKLDMPVLYMGGENDVMLPSEKCGKRLSQVLPQATVKVIPSAGHLLFNTPPEIISFLQGGANPNADNQTRQ